MFVKYLWVDVLVPERVLSMRLSNINLFSYLNMHQNEMYYLSMVSSPSYVADFMIFEFLWKALSSLYLHNLSSCLEKFCLTFQWTNLSREHSLIKFFSLWLTFSKLGYVYQLLQPETSFFTRPHSQCFYFGVCCCLYIHQGWGFW